MSTITFKAFSCCPAETITGVDGPLSIEGQKQVGLLQKEVTLNHTSGGKVLMLCSDTRAAIATAERLVPRSIREAAEAKHRALPITKLRIPNPWDNVSLRDARDELPFEERSLAGFRKKANLALLTHETQVLVILETLLRDHKPMCLLAITDELSAPIVTKAANKFRTGDVEFNRSISEEAERAGVPPGAVIITSYGTNGPATLRVAHSSVAAVV